MGGIWYCTREDVKGALDSAQTARNDAQVDRAVAAGSRSVEGLLHRKFRPVVATRSFPWPDEQRPPSWVLWLNGNELVSLTSLTAGGTTIPTGNLLLEPNEYGPPFNRIEVDLSTSSAFQANDTHQRAIVVTGVWGYDDVEEQVGELAANLDADVDATASITWTSTNIGVGDVLRIGSERMIVTGRTMVDTTQDLQADMTASAASVTVAVSSGTAFSAGQLLLVDAERMLVVDVAGNNVVVKRAWDGSVLAAHSTGASVYALTGVDVDRAQLGTALAAHSNTDPIYRHVVPDLVRQLAVAEAINSLQQETAGYARRERSVESEREIGGDGGLDSLRARCRRRYGRKARTAAI